MKQEFSFDTNLIRGAKGYSSDSRNIKADLVFVAIKGTQHDGHDFITPDLLEKSFKVLASKDWLNTSSYKNHPKIIGVTNTHEAHRDCAKYFRALFKGKIIGIGGSSGKTSVKEFLFTLLNSKYRCFKTYKSQNGELGIPKTLEQLNDQFQFGIIEIGIDAPGDMARHCDIVRPDLAILTSIGEEHLNLLKTIDNVFLEEKILFDTTLSRGGQVFAPSEDKYLSTYQGKQHAHMSSAISDSKKYTLPSLSRIQIQNACLAIKVCEFLGMSDSEISQAVKQLKPAEGRGIVTQIHSSTIIEDHYNSNPSSLKQSLLNFSELKNTHSKAHTILVIGDMLDLGEQSEAAHLALLKDLKIAAADKVFFVGDNFARALKKDPSALNKVEMSDNSERAASTLVKYLTQIQAQFLILFKGSRGIKLEKCLDAAKKFLETRT